MLSVTSKSQAAKNCLRVNRQCVYKPRKIRLNSLGSNPETASPKTPTQEASHSPQSLHIANDQAGPGVLDIEQGCRTFQAAGGDGRSPLSLQAVRDPFLSPDLPIVDVASRLEAALRRQNELCSTADQDSFDSTLPSTLISRDIELTTTMDILATRDVPLQPLFLFFVEDVTCSAITPYDGVNWQRMKLEVVKLGTANATVASAIAAVAALYKAQLYRLPLSKATSLYESARFSYRGLLENHAEDFGILLVSVFLLSLFEFVNYEYATPVLKDPDQIFLDRLKAWAELPVSHSGLALRIVAWLRLLHAATIRGGGMGIISEHVCRMLPGDGAPIPNIRSPSSPHSNTSEQSIRNLSAPIFEFYFRLQMISGDIAKSRTITGLALPEWIRMKLLAG